MTRPAKSYYCHSCRRYTRGRGNTNKEGEIPCVGNKYKASATYQAH